MSQLNYLLVVCTICIVVQCVSAYKTYQLSELCPANILKHYFNNIMQNKPEVLLGEEDESAAIIQQTWNSSSFKRVDKCSFNVDATQNISKLKNRGLYISIKRLNLRKASNGINCTDYIQFKFGSRKTPKICGVLNAAVDDAHKIYFGETGGVIKIYIFIDKQIPLRFVEDTLDIELVATAHQACDPNTVNSQIKCINSDENSCISRIFDNDHIVNCPPPYCTDERGICPVSPTVVKATETKSTTSSGTDMLVTALTSLIFTLVGVGSCLWLCLHIKDCCISESGIRGSNSGNIGGSNAQRGDALRGNAHDDDSLPAFSPTLEMPTSGTYLNRPSAPPINHKDTDKPPAYDSLFPDPNETQHNS